MPVPTRGMFLGYEELEREYDREIKIGDVYVEKGRRLLTSVLIITEVQGDFISLIDTSCRNTGHDFNPISEIMGRGILKNFLERYEKLTLQQLKELTDKLREEQTIITKKINLLEEYAQSQPKYTDSLESHCCPDYAELDCVMSQTLRQIKGK